MYLDPFSLFLGEAKVAKVCWKAPTSSSSRTRPATPTSRCCRRPTARARMPARTVRSRSAANPAFPWINTIEVRNSTLTISEGARAGRRSCSRWRAATFKSNAAQPAAADRGAARRAARRAARDHAARSARSTAGCAACRATSTCRAASAAAGSRSRAASASRAPTCRSTARGRTSPCSVRTSRLPLPSGGPYALNAKVSTQRSSLKVEVPTLKVGASELTGDALFRVDRSGTPTITVNVDASKIDLAGLRAPPAPPAPTPVPRPRAASCRRCRFPRAGWDARRSR